MYRNYEEYMQSVLGYSAPSNNTYRETNYDVMRVNQNMQEVNSLYPEIYGIVYPVVQKVCSRISGYSISKEQIDQMVDEVYNVIEPREEVEDTRENLKNGDVKNPRAKETRRPRPNNYLLRDLIRILLIRELLSNRPGGLRKFWTRFYARYANPRRTRRNATNNETTEIRECFKSGES